MPDRGRGAASVRGWTDEYNRSNAFEGTCRLYVADVKLRISKEHSESEKETSTYPDVMLARGDDSSELYEENPLLIADSDTNDVGVRKNAC